MPSLAKDSVNRHSGAMSKPSPRVALFVTCLVDLFRPTVGFAAVKLLEDAGCTVEVPISQTCCGQPAYNSGDRATSRDIARQVIDVFADYDYVVAPSGSCAGMIKKHYPALFDDDPEMESRGKDLSGRTHELTAFLVDVMGWTEVVARLDKQAAYHDSCSGLRELGIKDQPRALLAGVEGLTLSEYAGAETCCGFGGTFCVKYSDISDHMAGQRAEELGAVNLELLLGGDMGCLMNLAGKLSRDGSAVEVRHVAEVLAGTTNGPAIAKGPDST